MIALHQDTWQWRDPSRVFFGLLPVGLAWHAAYSVLSALVMAALVRFAWPAELDADGAAEMDGKSNSQAERAP